jgi:hypothetical protein
MPKLGSIDGMKEWNLIFSMMVYSPSDMRKTQNKIEIGKEFLSRPDPVRHFPMGLVDITNAFLIVHVFSSVSLCLLFKTKFHDRETRRDKP